MSFLINDEKFLEKYYKISRKVSNSIKKDLESKLAYNQKHLKAKIKSYDGKIKTNFHNNNVPKEFSQCICLSLILIDSVYWTDRSYYPQVLLEKCKYVVRKNKRRLSLL